jgi:hypothetical protein
MAGVQQLSQLLDGDDKHDDVSEAQEAFERASARASQAESDASEGRRRLEAWPSNPAHFFW